MDASRLVLLLTACFALVLLVRSLAFWRRQKRVPAWWLGVSSVGLALCALVAFAWPEGTLLLLPAYFVLLALVPAVLIRAIAVLNARRQYGRAATLSRLLALVNWSSAVRAQTRFLLALEDYERGRTARGASLLTELEREGGTVGRTAWLTRLRHENAWEAIRARLESELPRPAQSTDPQIALQYVRALGELGAHQKMIEAANEALERVPAPLHAFLFLPVLAFGGRNEELARLLGGPLAAIGADLHAYWKSTALFASDREHEGRALLASTPTSRSQPVASAIARRLEQRAPVIDPALWESDSGRKLTQRIEGELAFLESASVARARRPWLTIALALANVAVFLGAPPGPDYEHRLYDLGALALPMRSFAEDGWRVVTACFLHYGWAHLLLNLAALLYFGSMVERRLGPLRSALVYALSGFGAFALMAALPTSSEAHIVVGASGAIMGLMAAQIAILLRSRALRSRTGRRALGGLLLLFLLQSAFDLVTPEVAMSGHLWGALIGFVVGLALTPAKPATAAV